MGAQTEQSAMPGGFTGDPAAPQVADLAGCCGNPSTTAAADAGGRSRAAPSPCCGTSADAQAAESCCASAAKAEAVEAKAGCCG